jgi:hypothetical protein
MYHSSVNILDLCDEILLIIFNKLKNIDVLYSLIEVNRKFDKLAEDITFTRSIDLMAIPTNEEKLLIHCQSIVFFAMGIILNFINLFL